MAQKRQKTVLVSREKSAKRKPKIKRGKESEYVIARPAGNVQNFTTIRKLKEDTRKMRHDRVAETSNVQESCQP
ncbi:hypothetical protein CCACVL1_12225 [Corchorus capsularis]|uniref:Uncharacterized protein n=1 Tax=Corchorus capsularis TaxID=210143 RepID=A0A1R3IGR0_COCAP|nr:hypothetical protein CCACVL1_12225 [Corchorus capsularis]